MAHYLQINNQTLCARRNELYNMHIQSLKSRIKQFRDEGKLCDTVLESKDGTQFRVHWIVLQSRGVWWTAGRDEKHT